MGAFLHVAVLHLSSCGTRGCPAPNRVPAKLRSMDGTGIAITFPIQKRNAP